MFSGACNSCAIAMKGSIMNNGKKKVMSSCKSDFLLVTVDHIIKLWHIV